MWTENFIWKFRQIVRWLSSTELQAATAGILFVGFKFLSSHNEKKILTRLFSKYFVNSNSGNEMGSGKWELDLLMWNSISSIKLYCLISRIFMLPAKSLPSMISCYWELFRKCFWTKVFYKKFQRRIQTCSSLIDWIHSLKNNLENLE